ncbi:MAG: RHS repeat-associated core domain-containing protein [Caldilineaceae bacterium]|nr:RHS repeat-associated core domain-containing protein [Caldilineaceae bacterium]
MTTYSSSGTRQSERAYYAFGDDRRTVNTPLTDNLFTDQKQDESGLYYYNARYYDPEIGHFISPDTIVPDPLRVDAYNRYMYALGNPLKFNDPSGYYSDEALFAHFNCTDWACVEAHFLQGGSHEGRWGWLDILRRAENGDLAEVTAFSANDAEYARATGRFATINGQIVVEDVTWDIFDGRSLNEVVLGDNMPEKGFASLAFANLNGKTAHRAIYGMNHDYSTPRQQRAVDCDHYDCATRMLNAISTGSAGVAAACATSLVGNAGCSEIAGAVSLGSSGVSTLRTAWMAYNGDATTADLTVSTMTTTASVIATAKRARPVIGFGISVGQALWDEFGPDR